MQMRQSAVRCLGVAIVAAILTLASRPVWSADTDGAVGLEEIIVTSTRTPTLIREEPLRVEAVPAEEIEENLTVQPGNLTSLLNELPGVRVQSAAPGLGGTCLLYTSPSPRDRTRSRMPSSA